MLIVLKSVKSFQVVKWAYKAGDFKKRVTANHEPSKPSARLLNNNEKVFKMNLTVGKNLKNEGEKYGRRRYYKRDTWKIKIERYFGWSSEELYNSVSTCSIQNVEESLCRCKYIYNQLK